MSSFKYVDKACCVCGACLSKPAGIIYKTYTQGAVRFACCPTCGSWNQSPQITVESLVHWYNSDEYQVAGNTKSEESIYLNYEASEEQRQVEARGRFDRDLVQFLARGGRMIEVGCASGSLLAVMREFGWTVEGVDLSERFAEMGKRLNGLDISVDDFLNYECIGARFNLIVMLGTISNLQDLGAHLRHVYELLEPGGVFYFNFPVSDSLIARLYGSNFWMFTPSVSTFLSTRGMNAALTIAGFGEVHFQQDWQRPSFAKILGQAKLMGLYRFAKAIGVAHRGLAFSLPVPGVMVGWARRK